MAVRFLKRLGYFLAFAMVLLAAGCLIPRPFFQGTQDGDNSVEILVISNPIHTDIALPATPELLAKFSFLAKSGMPLDNPNVRWLMIGWGGRAFYLETPTWSELKFTPVIKSLTADTAALHIEPLGTISEPNPAVTRLKITQAGFDAVTKEVLATFARDADGNTELIAGHSYGEYDKPELIVGKSYGQYDRFYEAKGTFNALVGCNTWAAKMLRYAGLQTGWWNPFPQSLRLSLNLQN
jgi:uncharacterized protein (TIGR02117 family)